jgi:hypothetical protein
LILYGEEATKQAQKEGEEAAAAYEQEKRDIAAGIVKVPAPPPKPEKKQKRKPGKKKSEQKDENGGETGEKPSKKKRITKEKEEPSGEKKPKSAPKVDKESIAPILAKAVGKVSYCRYYSVNRFSWLVSHNDSFERKAPILAPRDDFKDMSEIELAQKAAMRIMAARGLGYCVSDIAVPAPVKEEFRPCAPMSSTANPSGGAMLLGLSSSSFGWDATAFVASRYFESDEETNSATRALAAEYGRGGFNERFRTLVQGTICILGSASVRTQTVYASLGLGTVPIGGSVGSIDCHIGGTPSSCCEVSASIRFMPTASGDFQFSALSNDDIVTMNGQRVTSDMGSFPLFNEDICTVGSRAFVFLLPIDT